MPSTRHHAEWLSLIEVSGPFLTLPVLERVFPQGLDKDDSPEAKAHARNLRLAFEEWEDNQTGKRPNPAIHRAWIDFVLKQTLGFSKDAHPEFDESCLAEGQKIPQTLMATIAKHGETLRPDVVVRNPQGVPDAGKARLLVQIYPVEQNLERPSLGRHWNASPATRMMELLHATDVRLGLVTNGEHWMLVDAPRGDTTGFASWYATLWFEEPLTLRAFRSLLGVRRFFSWPTTRRWRRCSTRAPRTSRKSPTSWGFRCGGPSRCSSSRSTGPIRTTGGNSWRTCPKPVLYEAALTVMMRLVFLFSAEENKLIPAQTDDELYLQHYAVSTLLAQLQEAADQHGEEVLERRLDAWVRLLSTFRAVFGGVQHDRLKLPAYAGKPVQSRPLPVPRRAQSGRRRGADTQPPRRCRSTTARCSTCCARSNTCKGTQGRPAAAELPGARHRADRPRLRGSARPHRQAGHRADAGPDWGEGQRAGGRPCRTGAAHRPRARPT